MKRNFSESSQRKCKSLKTFKFKLKQILSKINFDNKFYVYLYKISCKKSIHILLPCANLKVSIFIEKVIELISI